MKKLVEGDYVVPTTEEKKVEPVTKTVRVIDWLRPDHALARSLAFGRPNPTGTRNDRVPHEGKREVQRRKKQIERGFIKVT